MASWEEFHADAPDLAGLVRGRFEAHGLALLATLRADGSPRISGIETTFAAGELWLGMMHGSLKARDLRRDPRFALHSATVDKDVTDGDAKVAGRAIEVTDAEELRRFVDLEKEHSGNDVPQPFHLFRLDVTEASIMRPAGDHITIDLWTEGSGTRHVDRY